MKTLDTMKFYRMAIVVLMTTFLNTLAATQQPKKPLAHSLDGAVLFQHYCASCHGTGGEGNGPAAPALKVSVPNLALLTKHAGEFPRQRIRNILEGTESPVPHGSQKMPVWGPVFHEIDADQDLGHVRIDNVVKYIASLQKK